MTDLEAKLFNELKLKMDQHEATITQLLEIVAATNRRLSEIVEIHAN